MKFAKFYPVDGILYIEIILDKYLEEQPLTRKQAKELAKQWVPYIKMINRYTVSNNITKQRIVFDMDKALNFQRLNFTLAAFLTHDLVNELDSVVPFEIHVTHMNTMNLSIYTGFKSLLPTDFAKLIFLS
jgi:hypothetical protein